MPARGCTSYVDGLHRWRYGVGRWAGTPYYGCDGCDAVVLPTGDGVGEDYAYLGASGIVVREDGRTPYAVTVAMTAVTVRVVLAADEAEARTLAMLDGEAVADLIERRVEDEGVTVVDTEVIDAEVAVGEVMPA